MTIFVNFVDVDISVYGYLKTNETYLQQKYTNHQLEFNKMKEQK